MGYLLSPIGKCTVINMDVLKKINKLRIERNWSVYRLSVESGIPQSTITNMFNRETLPSITTLEMLCQAFGISLSEFFYDENEEKQSVKNDALYAMIEGLSDGEKQILIDLVRVLSNKK